MGSYERRHDTNGGRYSCNRYLTNFEKDGGRDEVHYDLAETIRPHKDRPERLADVDRPGNMAAAKTLSEAMPRTSKRRSGGLVEILATELVEKEIGARAPARRLRFEDGRSMAMHGGDFIGDGYDGKCKLLGLLKGEARSNKVLGKATTTSARKMLNCDSGRSMHGSLLFVANRLPENYEPDSYGMSRRLGVEEGLKSLRADCTEFMPFTLSCNRPHVSLKLILDAAGTNRVYYYVNIHFEDSRNSSRPCTRRRRTLGAIDELRVSQQSIESNLETQRRRFHSGDCFRW